MRMYLHTNTPIHIGTGEKYGEYEFYIENDKLRRVDIYSIFRDRELSVKYTDAMEKGNIYYARNIMKNGKVLYSAKLASGKNKGIREVREAIKDSALKVPYIPGSSLKGAVRTALIVKYLKDNNWNFALSVNGKIKKYNLWDAIENGIGDLNVREIFGDREDRDPKFLGSRFERMIVYFGDIRHDNRGYKGFKYDAKYDILKYLLIGDFYPKDVEMRIYDVSFYAKRRRREEHVEGITGVLAGEITLSPDLKVAIDSGRYPLLEEKIRILGLEKSDLSNRQDAESKMIKHILEATGEFVNDIATYNGDEKPNEVNMRIGFGVGTLYQGFWKYLRENLPEDLSEEILRRFNKKARFETYPKTKKVLEDGYGLGWCRLAEKENS